MARRPTGRDATAALLGLAVLCVATTSEGMGILQPFPFNHRIHTENGLTCDTCHEQVFRGPHAGMPSSALCLGCHEADIASSPAALPYIETVRRHGREGTEIGWVRIYQLPKHVYYSHRRHAGIAQLPCETCHGEIGQSETPPAGPIKTTLDMDNCINCHKQHDVQNDCAWCHR